MNINLNELLCSDGFSFLAGKWKMEKRKKKKTLKMSNEKLKLFDRYRWLLISLLLYVP